MLIWLVGCQPSRPVATKDGLPTATNGNSSAATQSVNHEPETLLRSEVLLDDLELVIGLSVGNQFRAYLVEAFRTLSDKPPLADSPVVNDFLNGVPLTVTYCDRTRCARVFTRPEAQALQVTATGWQNGELVLLWKGTKFRQQDSRPPLDDYPFVMSTWKDWAKIHPDTDVYLGSLEE